MKGQNLFLGESSKVQVRTSKGPFPKLYMRRQMNHHDNVSTTQLLSLKSTHGWCNLWRLSPVDNDIHAAK